MAGLPKMKHNDTTTDTGRRGEAQAARFLEERGLKVLTRNYHCRGGELDLVCREGKTLVFVEVRLRSSKTFGGAAASITPTKQRRIILAAQHYLVASSKPDTDCRIDCVLIESDAITWLKNAIEVA